MTGKFEDAIDESKMYFGEDFVVNDRITIHQPKVGEIVDFGEREYFTVVHELTCIPSDMKSFLFDSGIDYEKISDYKLFLMLSHGLKQEQTSILLGDVDLSSLTPIVSGEADKEDSNIRCVDTNGNTVIDYRAYRLISGYLRKLHHITPRVEHAASKTVKRLLIQLDRDRVKKMEAEGYKSSLRPLISAMMRYPGFKYKMSELKEVGFYEFMDCVYGAQIYVNSTALLQGAYSGMIDTKKLDKKELNPLRDFTP